MMNDALINAPIEALTFGLKLSNVQQAKIAGIQASVHAKVSGFLPQPGGQMDFTKLQEGFEKIRRIDDEETKRIEGLLTAAQKKVLPAVLKEIRMLESAGIPPALMGKLSLTTTQKREISRVTNRSQKEMQERLKEVQQDGDFEAMRGVMQKAQEQQQAASMKVLTPAQNKTVASYLKSHPQPQGGFGGFGPPMGG